ncbi:MAG TPA: hypothetical protein VFR66_14465 [Burkholderiales bacterium]|nr:hypothetical protein [Burkholderiales bacterium]
MRAYVLGALLLAGCSSNTAWQLSAGTPPPPNSAGSVHVHTSSGFATAVGVTVLFLGAYEFVQGGVPYASPDRRPPEMAPDRRVSEQDCTKPLDLTLGNIRCK